MHWRIDRTAPSPRCGARKFFVRKKKGLSVKLNTSVPRNVERVPVSKEEKKCDEKYRISVFVYSPVSGRVPIRNAVPPCGTRSTSVGAAHALPPPRQVGEGGGTRGLQPCPLPPSGCRLQSLEMSRAIATILPAREFALESSQVSESQKN